MRNKSQPYITYLIIAANIIVFFLEEIQGGSESTQTAVRFGALYAPLVFEYGQWWRLFTAMWLHFGIQHIGSNMLSLFAIGPYVEAYFGRVRYLILYVFAGLCGNLLVYFSDLGSGRYSVSAGASGAICGLLSVLIIFALTPGMRRYFPLPRVLFSIFLVLLPGLTDRSISMGAHVGGLIGGFVLAAIMNAAKIHQRNKGKSGLM